MQEFTWETGTGAYELTTEKGNTFLIVTGGSMESQPSTEGIAQQLGVLFVEYEGYTEYGNHIVFL